jgi:hypothetical protein
MRECKTVSRRFAVIRGHRSSRRPERDGVTAWTLTDRLAFATDVNVARLVEDGQRYTEWAGAAR